MLVRRFYTISYFLCMTPSSFRHIDGHHKLIRWRLVIHGAIDGYSRLITYLRCSTNNKASTVFELFRQAIEIHGLPSRMRSDYGVENVDIAWFMLTCPEKGINRGSMITGSSVHNQRIERLWGRLKELLCCITKIYSISWKNKTFSILMTKFT